MDDTCDISRLTSFTKRPSTYCTIAAIGLYCLGLIPQLAEAQSKIVSHPPLRIAKPLPPRPAATGPSYYVATTGDDGQDGSQAKPWKTIQHAVARLQPGDTLLLRAGTYYENVTVRLTGRSDAPITIRAFPGEHVVLDGGLREFFDEPASAWEPYPQGVDGEYRSTRSYPNLRHVLGSFGDSMVGLVAYYHATDLRGKGELFEQDEATKDWKPLYCGPGLWYDPVSGRIHARLSHTHLPNIDNYRGETDPRKLPLVIAPFRSLPLRADGARHVRFYDLTIRGAGYDAVILDQASDVVLDNVVVWCGSYGLRATGVERFKFLNSALYGSIPPWLSRAESSLQSYPGRSERDIARLNTHAVLVAEAGREFSVYAFPFNDHWEIAHSEFTDASDGVYLGGINMKFHHNLVDNMQDDGLYLSPMYLRYERLLGKAELHIYQNYFSRALTMLAYGGPELVNTDQIYFYRNILDLRAPVGVNTRPRAGAKDPYKPYSGHVMGDHGSPPWPALFSYHNTIVSHEPARGAEFLFLTTNSPDRPRRAFNNLYLHGAGLKSFTLPDNPSIQSDGHVYWQPDLSTESAAAFFNAYRASPAFTKSKTVYPPGFDASSVFADPKLVKFTFEPGTSQMGEVNDYRLQPGSPAVDVGVPVPADWVDPLRTSDAGKPDVGALPLGAEMLRVGR